MAMKISTRPQNRQRRNNRMTKTQKTKKIKSIETKDGDRDDYSRQQQEYQEGHISSDLDYKPAAASKPLNDLDTHQAYDIEMTMPTIQNQQQGTPEEESELPMIHRADSYGRIPAPHENDVLCGRGGSINSHPGNITFREWVYERKTQYNLADSKKDKTIVVNEVLDLVRSVSPPGRFLQKHNSGWIEIDDAKAMAKISQALREGAPAMRAAHGKKATKRRSDSTRSPSPPRRESKRRAKKRNFDDYVPSETVPASSNLLSPNVAISSAPLTPPPSLEGNEDYHHHDDLMRNDHVYNYFDHTGGLNELLLEQSNEASAAAAATAAGRDLQPHGGDYKASFISPSSYSHHPLIPLGDYRASISEVANAIPPSQIGEMPPRANNITPTLTSLPPPPISPGGWDPLSFLPSTPKHARSSVEVMGQSFFPLTPNHAATSAPTSPYDANAQGQAFSLQQKQSVRREHSLDASLGSFSNPFENDSNHFRQYPQLGLPIPNLGPPQRGLSFGMIGGMPKAKEVDTSLRRRDTSSSYSSNKSRPSSSQNERKRPPL